MHMTLFMPVALSDFTPTMELHLQTAVATVLGVDVSHVRFPSIEALDGRRRLLTSGVRVVVEIVDLNPDTATYATELLVPETINTALEAMGLPPATMLEAPSMTGPVQGSGSAGGGSAGAESGSGSGSPAQGSGSAGSGSGSGSVPALAACTTSDDCGGSERGACVAGRCECSTGFKGLTCDLCDAGRTGRDCSLQCSFPWGCSGHGRCSGTEETCICNQGWAGEQCEIEAAAQAGSGSSGSGSGSGSGDSPSADESGEMCESDAGCGGSERGVCASGRCECSTGFKGLTCDLCDAGRTGRNCSLQCSFPWGCSGHGRCSGLHGECICYAGWTGAECETFVAPNVVVIT